MKKVIIVQTEEDVLCEDCRCVLEPEEAEIGQCYSCYKKEEEPHPTPFAVFGVEALV